MPRRALCCRINLKIKKVTCPGTLHLADRNLVFITVSLLAQTKRTKSVFASFPFEFHENITFERVFTNASNLDQLLEILEDETVSIELRQHSERYYDGDILAKFEAPSRQFLFPAPSFKPRDGINRDLLLTRTSHFPVEKGIDPKLSFSTKTKIEETAIASSSREHLSLQSHRDQSFKKSPSPLRTSVRNTFSSSSETEEEIIITTPRKGSRDCIQFQHCVCECRNRPENNGHYVIRSRSVSPGKEGRRKSKFDKPPFKAGRAPTTLISKRDFGASSPRRNGLIFTERKSFPCPECRVPHPDCSMCRAYKQTYGNKFFQFRFASDFGQSPLQKSPSPTTLGKRTPKSKANTPRARARIPITSPTSSDEDEDRYRAALTVSSQRRNRNTKMFHTPVQISPKAMNRSGSHVRSAVKELLRKNDPVLQYELTDSELEDSLISDVSTEEDTMNAKSFAKNSRPVDQPERSVVVPLSSQKYWSKNAQKYSGRSHREIFNDSLSEIYKSLYESATHPN